MAKRTIKEIKKIEEDIHLALQILRNEIETLTIIKEHTIFESPDSEKANLIIKDELEESFSSIEELMDLHKNLENQIDKLEGLVQDLISTKA